jgi:hypothetical protein
LAADGAVARGFCSSGCSGARMPWFWFTCSWYWYKPTIHWNAPSPVEIRLISLL